MPGEENDLSPAFQAHVLSSERLFTGEVFSVNRCRVELSGIGETRAHPAVITRDLVEHAPCVVMLVHDVPGDLYFLQYEYRIGAGGFVPGLPAGFIDSSEGAETAMLREIREETGVVPEPDGYWIDPAGDFYSSEGMSDELAHIAVVHLTRWRQGEQDLDQSEYIQGGWVSWERLLTAGVTASNSVIAIQHERIRRILAREAAGQEIAQGLGKNARQGQRGQRKTAAETAEKAGGA